jgi:Flp pilus assembly protein TadD
MNRKMLARIATMSLMLGISTIACTPNGARVAAIGDQAPKAQEMAAKSANKARTALASHRGVVAVDAAEKAVAFDPHNGGYRMLLGQSYLAAGRFASAETSFRDSLTLTPDQPKARFDMALAQIAQGRDGLAQATLHGLQGAIPEGDLGLALALSGDRQDAIAMLVEVVRSGKSDARVRQNLALAFALNGQWRESRAVAMQDTSADKIDDQIAHWTELARPQAGGTIQVAAMLGVKPVNDPGLPTELALANPTPGDGGVQVALADPAPAVPVAVAPAPTAVVTADAGLVTVPLDNPAPAAMPADAPAVAVVLAAQKQAALRPDLAPPPLLRASQAPFRRAIMAVQPEPAFRSSGYVVQLGAFAKAGAIQTAWEQASKMMPRLTGFAPARAQFSFSGTSLVRLSVSGFATRADAVKLCDQIHSKGSRCFVRATAGDAPLQWVKRDAKVQLASR